MKMEPTVVWASTAAAAAAATTAQTTVTAVAESAAVTSVAVATAMAAREPESEDATTTAAYVDDQKEDRKGSFTAMDDIKRESCYVGDGAPVAPSGDVDMQCEEAAEPDQPYGECDGESSDNDEYGARSPRHLRDLDAAPVREYPEEYARYMLPVRDAATAAATLLASPMWGGSGSTSAGSGSGSGSGSSSSSGTKRKRLNHNQIDPSDATEPLRDPRDRSLDRVVIGGIDYGRPLPVATKRKGSSDFLRKGQWTPTEERLAKLLIDAFEDGYLPVYTGIRLRGYLAVQLQCDPMRVSKKLCAGTIDGKKIPKNYGQKKFRLRKKLLWDREEAGRILATLERLTRELWAETGMAPPPYLTLSSTRNAEEEMSPLSHDGDHTHHTMTNMMTAAMQGSPPVKKLSPPSNKSKKQKNGVVFPIIYLNLSKKIKQSQGGNGAVYNNVMQYYGSETPQSDASSSTSSCEESARDAQLKVDGESLQAAYELLNLFHHATAPSTSSSPSISRSSTPSPPSPSASSSSTPSTAALTTQTTHTTLPETTGSSSTASSNAIPIRPAPAKPSILRQQAP